MLIQVIQHHIRHRITLQIKNNTHSLTIRLITNLRNTLDTLIIHQIRTLLNQRSFINHVRNLRHNYLLFTILIRIKCRISTNYDTTSTRLKCIFNPLNTVYGTSCWKIWRLDVLHQLRYRNVTIINICSNTINHLSQVVWRHIRRHTHRNT